MSIAFFIMEHMMKKTSLIMIIFMSFSALAFSQSQKFYNGSRVRDTMFIDSPEGLRVRTSPDLKGTKICTLQNRHPVKIISIGKETVIDGIKAPWVEILLPYYEWKNEDDAEFGWVFGGYLSEKQKKFKSPKTKYELEKYLSSTRWREYENDEICYYVFSFKNEGRFWHGKDGSGIGEGGDWKATSSNTVSFHTSYVMEYEEDSSWSLTFTFRDDGSFYYSGSGKTFYCYPDIFNRGPEFYSISTKETYLTYIQNSEWSPYNGNTKEQVVSSAIKKGAPYEGSMYENEYHEYWDPIMKEHQDSADLTKR